MCSKNQQTVFPWGGDVLVRQWWWESHQQRQAAWKHEEGNEGQVWWFSAVCNLLCVRCILISMDNHRTELQSDLEKASLKQKKRDIATQTLCVPVTPMNAYYISWLWHLDEWTNFICIGAGQDFAFEIIFLAPNPSNRNSTFSWTSRWVSSTSSQEAKDVPEAARLSKALDSFKIPAAGEEPEKSMRKLLNVAGNHVFQCEWLNFLRFLESFWPVPGVRSEASSQTHWRPECCSQRDWSFLLQRYVHSQVSYRDLI